MSGIPRKATIKAEIERAIKVHLFDNWIKFEDEKKELASPDFKMEYATVYPNLKVRFVTTGFKRGDWGHGARHLLIIENAGSVGWAVKIIGDEIGGSVYVPPNEIKVISKRVLDFIKTEKLDKEEIDWLIYFASHGIISEERDIVIMHPKRVEILFGGDLELSALVEALRKLADELEKYYKKRMRGNQ